MIPRGLAVYCGSSVGVDPVYARTARALAGELASRGIAVVYGGGNVGLMGVLADAALEAGGEVIGVIPRTLVEKEVAHGGLTRLEIVDTMAERKRLMGEFAGGFVAMPGGHGTLDELFENVCEVQLGFHRKPVGLLNVGGFYDGLLDFLDHLVRTGFVNTTHRAMYIVEENPARLVDRFLSYSPANGL